MTINAITNILAAIAFIIEPVRAYLSSQPFNWGTFIPCVIGAVIAWYTGKQDKPTTTP